MYDELDMVVSFVGKSSRRLRGVNEYVSFSDVAFSKERGLTAKEARHFFYLASVNKFVQFDCVKK